ncbi:threonine/serine dehydratase [Chondromyces crocatus]|uniref:Serine/threonine dehydratase n=1 Tax=Chondromyces crocatus TaxID=52 RepID=A0A0K1EDS8_CHOCO|nr:threonine/serine dehydratase [Chondromyces crocatus]AKT39030.1 serine/threonine dehydratase [Chondromyces crocatus]
MNEPPLVTRDDITAAAQRIDAHVRTTPIIRMETGAFGIQAALVLKLESLQHTGSFKVRGAFNRMLSADVPPAGVIAASGGNHGVAVAYAAQRLGHVSEIFVPRTAASVKVERLRRYGARVTQVGERYADALLASQARARETGALEVHAFDQPEVVAGQGTLGREFQAQAPEVETLLVAVGGGGLIAGVASWTASEVRVVSVEPEAAPTLHAALQAGRPTTVPVAGVAVDALGASRVGEIAFAVARRHIERAVLVDDEAILAARRVLWDELRIATEPSGAAAFSALLSGAYRPREGERVGVVICGGNADPRTLA